MNRVLVIVSGGIADYVADDGIEIRIFDEDNISTIPPEDRGSLSEEFEGFEDLMPSWAKDLLLEDAE